MGCLRENLQDKKNMIFDGEKWEKPGFPMDFPFNPVRNAELRISGCQELRYQKLNESDERVDTSATSSTSPNDQTKTMNQWIGLYGKIYMKP